MDGFFGLFGGSPRPGGPAAAAAPDACAAGPDASTSASSGSGGANAPSSTDAKQQKQQEDQKHAARINMPVVPNEALDPKTARLLSTQRAASTIPMSADAAVAPPRHQQAATTTTVTPLDKRGWGAWLWGGRGGSSKEAPPPPVPSPPPSKQQQQLPVWMYPSEAQFFAAMRRKGWDPRPEDMANVVRIHNAVNERAWMHVLDWEERRRHGGGGGALTTKTTATTPTKRLCACCGRANCAGAGDEVRLKRFVGRPADLSPKARLLNLFGYKLPFDRHDWVVERCCWGGGGGGDGEGGEGEQAAAAAASEEQQQQHKQQKNRRCVEARYVIDFYSGRALIPGVPAVHLDVRPAIDSPSAAWQRATAVGAALVDAAAAGLGLSPRPPPPRPPAGTAGVEEVQRILSQQREQQRLKREEQQRR